MTALPVPMRLLVNMQPQTLVELSSARAFQPSFDGAHSRGRSPQPGPHHAPLPYKETKHLAGVALPGLSRRRGRGPYVPLFTRCLRCAACPTLNVSTAGRASCGPHIFFLIQNLQTCQVILI